MDIFAQRRPLTPEQRLRIAQQRFASGAQQPMSLGQGIQQLGNGLALGIARNQYNQGNLPHEQASSGVRRITEALLGNQAPWQFPGAPQPGGGNAPSPQFNFGNMFAGLLGKRGPTGGGLY